MMTIKDEIIYVAQPYGGTPENYEKARQTIAALSKTYPDKCFISPILAFGHLYEDLSYDEGMELCYTLLDVCSELWTFGDSEGVRREKEYAARYKIPIREI